MKKYLLLSLLSLIIMQYSFSQTTPSAATIVKEASTKAKKEKKQVLLIFHASWCGWCHRMDSLITKTSLAKTFDKHFVLTHVTILEHKPERKKDENPGGMDLFEQYGGNANTGIPYWAVLDANGKLLANSRLKGLNEDLTGVNGDNVGCPGTSDEIAYWTTVLTKTANFTQKETDEVKVIFEHK